MAKVSIIAKLTTAEENVAAFEDALASMVTASDEEPGLEIYSVHKDPNTVGVYWFFELYTDGDALGVHGAGERHEGRDGCPRRSARRCPRDQRSRAHRREGSVALTAPMGG